MSNAYFEALGTESSSLLAEEGKLHEAYLRAHDIRKFEIEMYWKRSAYLWAIQAATLGGLALSIKNAKFAVPSCSVEAEQFSSKCIDPLSDVILVSAIWLFGAVSAYVWLLLLRGGKFWQNNWERHVDNLESQFSGALYKTYQVDRFDPPYSVSKLNEFIALTALVIWLLMGAFFVAIATTPTVWPATFAVFLAIPTFLAWLFDQHFRMSNFGKPIGIVVDADGKKSQIVRRPSLTHLD